MSEVTAVPGEGHIAVHGEANGSMLGAVITFIICWWQRLKPLEGKTAAAYLGWTLRCICASVHSRHMSSIMQHDA